MTTVAFPSSAVPYQQETSPQVSPLVSPPFVSPTSISTYSIVETRTSEHAKVLFTRQTHSSESVLMKLLHDYKDTRYSQETPKKRQQCQLEALRRNRAFSPEIYLGLARIEQYNMPNNTIRIGELLTCPTMNDLEPGAEYVLIMRQLPEERSLVALLQERNTVTLQGYIHLLTEHIAHIHTQLLATKPGKNDESWGTYGQLREKLRHNFGLLDLVLKTHIPGLDYDYLRTTIPWLEEKLQKLFNLDIYQRYFEQRVQAQQIQLCHGDLKSPNIWILPFDEASHRMAGQYVKILDAIDFNPTYCNIDILSDFAMLTIDIQTRTDPAEFVDEMIDHYLELTDQKDDSARAILAFYLIEKAFVGAAISIVYDDLPRLGMRLLDIAVTRLRSLLEQQGLSASAVQETTEEQSMKDNDVVAVA